jgi:hypothetical protein
MTLRERSLYSSSCAWQPWTGSPVLCKGHLCRCLGLALIPSVSVLYQRSPEGVSKTGAPRARAATAGGGAYVAPTARRASEQHHAHGTPTHPDAVAGRTGHGGVGGALYPNIGHHAAVRTLSPRTLSTPHARHVQLALGSWACVCDRGVCVAHSTHAGWVFAERREAWCGFSRRRSV